jgi:predicted dehydrogenase
MKFARLSPTRGALGCGPGLPVCESCLEDKTIDAISIATPNHNHALQAIWGCQAGKGVYVEKPRTYHIFEAKQLLAAGQKYGRMVQHGNNGCSSTSMQEPTRG